MTDTSPPTTCSPPPISLRILGAGRDVGRSCILLTLPQRQILLDCGAHPGFSDHRRYPELHTLPPLDAVVITHFHFDHAAALPVLSKLQPNAPVYMTQPTLNLARIMLHDVVTTSTIRRQHCPFTAADVDRALSTVKILPLGQSNIGNCDDIHVNSFYAGHVLGAVMVYIAHAGRSAFYTGDFCTSSDRHLRAADMPYRLSAEVHIMEATYSQTLRKEARFTAEVDIAKAVVETIKNNGKVLVPISAFGRAHIICSILDAHCPKEIQKVPMFISAGLASRACKEYANFRDWWANEECRICNTGLKRRRRFSDRCNHRAIDRLEEFGREEWGFVTASGPAIFFATPGNLSTGLSMDVFRVLGRSERNLVVVPGLTLSNMVASSLLDDAHTDNSRDVSGTAIGSGGIKCKVVNAKFGAHADRRALLRTIKGFESGCVVLVHGNEEGILEFRGVVEEHLEVKCYAPKNGETLSVEGQGGRDEERDDEVMIQDWPEEWHAIIDKYKGFMRKGDVEKG